MMLSIQKICSTPALLRAPAGATRAVPWLFACLVFLTLLAAGPAQGKTVLIGPADNWCGAVNSAAPGDEVVLAPGSYLDPCWISANGSPGSPIVLRSQYEDPSLRAVIDYKGWSSNVTELRDASHLVMRWLSFAPTNDGVDAIRIWKADDVLIEENGFEGIGGISISANTNSSSRITVRNNTFLNLKATGLYFGCHNGSDCYATEIVVEGNFIDGVDPYNQNSIGYGMEFKLNSYGTVVDNTVYNTKGPGIMVYGSNQGGPPSTVEGNYVEGSRTEGGIVVGGGPAIVRNNVLVDNAYGGISAQDYGGRGLQQGVWIVNNTILDNGDSGINVYAWGSGSGNIIAYNAISPRQGTAAVRPASPEGTVVGNITCAPGECFVQSATAPYDLWPVEGGVMVDGAGSGAEPWRPADDFMGAARGVAPDVGAFERTTSKAYHMVGGGSPRPLRASGETTPPSPPENLQIF